MSAPAGPFLAGFIGFAHAEAARDPAMADAMANLVDALERCTRVTPGVRPTYPVIDEHLGTCLGAAVGAPGDLLHLVADSVGWAIPYPEHIGEPDMDHMRANYAYAPIVGTNPISSGVLEEPSPLYASDDVFAGAVIQGPGVTYPSHVHKATEAFWVVAGTADWQMGDEWTSRGPGATIFHPTGTRHATVTTDEPQLVLFAWTSDADCVPVVIRS
jgi:mannose-6-phosphate isomerase-like protein (cupin superfamily)